MYLSAYKFFFTKLATETHCFIAIFMRLRWLNDKDNNNLSSYLPLQLHCAVVSQDYRTNVFEVSVLTGNSAILKCEVPSFVTDFVRVIGWIDETSGDSFHPSSTAGTFLFVN